MSGRTRLPLVVVLLGILAVLASCSSTPTEPEVPEMVPLKAAHDYVIAQTSRGQALAYVACSDCPRPTLKTLPAARPQLVSAASTATPPATPVARGASAPQPLVLFKTRTERFSVVFESGSSRLTREASERLEALLPLSRVAIRIRIVGYTDDQAGLALNTKLSEARALAVMVRLRDALAKPQQQIQPELIATGRPLCCYLTDNRDPRHRAPNRRVEVALELPDEPAIARLVRAARAHSVGASVHELVGDAVREEHAEVKAADGIVRGLRP